MAQQIVPPANRVRLWIKQLSQQMSVAKRLLEIAKRHERTKADADVEGGLGAVGSTSKAR